MSDPPSVVPGHCAQCRAHSRGTLTLCWTHESQRSEMGRPSKPRRCLMDATGCVFTREKREGGDGSPGHRLGTPARS